MRQLRPLGSLGIALLFCLMVAGGPPVARAQDATVMAQAKESYRLGDEAFRANQYPEALKHFQQGYELSGKKRFLLNIAHTKRLMGNLKGALADYEEFLAHDPRPEDRSLAENAVTELRNEIPPEEFEPAAPAPVVSAPAVDLVAKPAATETSEAPLVKRWYFWAAVGAVVVGAVAIGVAASSGGSSAPPFAQSGSWGRVDL